MQYLTEKTLSSLQNSKMPYTYIIFFYWLSFLVGHPNSERFLLHKTISIEAKNMETDRLGNLYVVTNNNKLYKYNSDGKLIGTLNYNYVGNITAVDASNPLEVYVFYQELNRILYLDNNLAYRGETDLGKVGVVQASAIARSFDNGIWAFDIADLQLKRIDKKGENVQNSGNVRQFVIKQIQPHLIIDNNDKVFVNDSINGVLVFDVFATYLKTIPIKGAKQLKVIEDDLYYYAQHQLFRYNQKSMKTFQFNLPDTNSINYLSIEKERLYIMRDKQIEIYTY